MISQLIARAHRRLANFAMTTTTEPKHNVPQQFIFFNCRRQCRSVDTVATEKLESALADERCATRALLGTQIMADGQRPNAALKTLRLLTMLLIICSATRAVAQYPYDYANGIQAYGSYNPDQIGVINLQSGVMTVDIPVLSYSQMGTLPPLTIDFVFAPTTWQIWEQQAGSSMGGNVYIWSAVANAGISDPTKYGTSSRMVYEIGGHAYTYRSNQMDYYYNNLDQGTIYASWAYDNVDGTTHTEVPDVSNGNWASIDGSGMSGNVDRNGIAFNLLAVATASPWEYVLYPSATDPNGNSVTASASGYTDSVGRSIPLFDSVESAAGCYPLSYPGPPPSGVSQVTVCESVHNVTTSLTFGEPSEQAKASPHLIDSITLPNGTAWGFSYDNYGNLIRVTLPTGGSIAYQWNQGPLRMISGQGGWSESMQVTSRTVSDANGNVSTWTYNYPFNSSDEVYLPTVVTDPQNNDTMHVFSGGSATAPEIETDYFSGRSTFPANYSGASSCSNIPSVSNLVKTVFTSYVPSGEIPLGQSTVMGGGVPLTLLTLPQTRTTVWPGGSTSQVVYKYDSTRQDQETENVNFWKPNQPPISNYSTGSLTDEYDYDYAPCGSTGKLLRHTHTDYEWQVNGAYANGNLLAIPADTITYDGNGNQVAATTYTYDEPSYGGTGVHGNATTISRWLNTATSPVVTHTYYNSSGMATQTVDALTVTNISYQCGRGAYPYQVITAGVTTSYTYDCNTGLVVATEDPNNVFTQYKYDTQRNLISKTFPDGGSVGIDYHGYVTPLVVTTQTLATPDPTMANAITYDGLGRPLLSQLPNGSYIAYGYDLSGRVCAVSNPSSTGPPTVGLSCASPATPGTSCSLPAQASPTGGITYTTYDSMGRTTVSTKPDGNHQVWCYAGNMTTFTDENGNQWQRATDSLGRLTQIVEPGSLTTNYTYDALGNLLGVTQAGAAGEVPRTRSFTYDSLSRLICASNPENGSVACPSNATSTMPSSGVALYSYDGDGNVLTKSSPQVNASTGMQTITYGYDKLNRLVSKTYSAGAPSSCYQYGDSAAGAAAVHLIGRLMVSWTQTGTTCPTSPPATGVLSKHVYLSYDAMGRLTSEQQCSKGSCGGVVYSPSYSYNLAGRMSTHSTGVDPYLFTNSYDAGGQLSTLTSTIGSQSPVNLFRAMQSTSASAGCSSTATAAYSPAGGLQNAIFGTDLQLTRSYDSRLRVNCEMDISSSPLQSPSAETVKITITGTDQTH